MQRTIHPNFPAFITILWLIKNNNDAFGQIFDKVDFLWSNIFRNAVEQTSNNFVFRIFLCEMDIAGMQDLLSPFLFFSNWGRGYYNRLFFSKS